MKFISYFFKDLFIKIIREKRIVFIMCFSLSVTIAVSFVLLKGLLLQLGNVQNVEDSKKSYFVVTECNIQDSRCIKTLSDIEKNPRLPDVTNSSNIYVASKSSDIEALAITQYNTLEQYQNNIIEEGNWITDEDVKDGNYVVVCNRDYLLNNHPETTIGDTISVFESNFIICGIFTQDDNETADIFVPYKALTKICKSKANDMFVSSTLNVDFTKELSNEQKMELINTANCYAKQTGNVKSVYDLCFAGNLLDSILYIGLICIMFVFCITNVINLFRYFSINNMYEYSILKICGSSNFFIAAIMYLQGIILVLISYCFGLFVYFVTEPLQNLLGLNIMLDNSIYFLILILVIIAIVFSCFPTIKKLSTISPVDKRLWR